MMDFFNGFVTGWLSAWFLSFLAFGAITNYFDRRDREANRQTGIRR